MSGLDVTALIDAVHELRCRVDAQPKADDASRYDWQTVLQAVTELHLHVREKLTGGNPT